MEDNPEVPIQINEGLLADDSPGLLQSLFCSAVTVCSSCSLAVIDSKASIFLSSTACPTPFKFVFNTAGVSSFSNDDCDSLLVVSKSDFSPRISNLSSGAEYWVLDA